MNEVLKTLFSHRSIRKYSDRPVSDEDVDLIIKAAQAAPSWVNLQLVSMIVVRDPQRKMRMAELANHQDHVAQAPVYIVFCMDYSRVAAACAKHGQTIKEALRDIDPVIVGAHEVGIALEAASVAAESLGLGIVPIGSARLNPNEMIEELALPKYVYPMVGLCVGYPAEDPGLKPRFPINAVSFREKYDPSHTARDVDDFDKRYAEYLANRSGNTRQGDWSETAANYYGLQFPFKDEPEALPRQGFRFKDR